MGDIKKDKKMTETNVITAIANNRKNLSQIGSNLGGQFHQVEVRNFIPDFENQKLRIQSEGNAELYVNRTMKRYRIVSKDIFNMGAKTDLSGQAVVYINEDPATKVAEVEIPFGNDMRSFGNINEDGLRRAIKGDNTMIFADVEKLATQLNALNNKEIKNIEQLISMLNKAKQACENSIVENTKKVAIYKRELIDTSSTQTDELELNVNVNKD